jgi:hypothetical protein
MTWLLLQFSVGLEPRLLSFVSVEELRRLRQDAENDEACGSASMLLAAHLGRAITIQHGRGSVVQASPAANSMADLGGRVVWDHERAVD